MTCGLSCSRPESPQAAFDHIYKTFLNGDLKQSQDKAHRECERFRDSSPEWAWRFRILEARSALWRGLYEDVLKLLRYDPYPSNRQELAVPMLTLLGVANIHTQNFPEAKRVLDDAARLCSTNADQGCGEVLQATGLLASAQAHSGSAETLYQLSLSFARAHGDSFLESDSLLNLGAEALTQGRFDEAIDRSEAAYQVAKAADAGILELVTQGNIGWALYRLGDSDKAIGLFHDAEKRARELGDLDDQGAWLTDAGYVYMGDRKFELAEQALRQSLEIAQKSNNKENIYNALRALARLAVQTGDLANASRYAQEALVKAKESKNHVDELYPLLVQGQVAARRSETAQAESSFREVESDKLCPVFLKWEAQHSLARLYEDQSHSDAADREYRAALDTFESARDDVRHEDSQLSFLTNAARIYDDYIHFLVTHGKTDDALRWADYNRARTLAEGLGLLTKAKTKGDPAGPPLLNAQEIARRAGGTVFFYWLGEKQSYLWVITSEANAKVNLKFSPTKTSLFTLPPGAEIDAAVQRYRKTLGGPQDVLASADPDGRWLYRTLIAPAQELLAARRSPPAGAKAVLFPNSAFETSAKVFIIPDGSLNNLNFETLLVSDPKLSEAGVPQAKLHYWIEDATIANASSLRVLGGVRRSARDGASPASMANTDIGKQKHSRSLLLVGNSVAPNDRYPELPKAVAQMESVARHFPAAEQRVVTREVATPAAYLESNPEQFSYIHFAAHGTASRLSPLDSAIVLSRTEVSKTSPSNAAPSRPAPSHTVPSQPMPSQLMPAPVGAEDDSFKLYAREIIRHPLRADLVTISACYGAEGRTYSGEGLVGLSWAFLRAGAHNVVAALWEVTDASTPQLMDKFYGELEKGANPDAALRAAKLSLLRDSRFQSPFYWAPFQLYAGS
jgi:CHAT domain-containing protein/tetratricopeptide (TPR) repeat protein